MFETFEEFINESISGENILCTDIQPEYQDNFTFDVFDWGTFLNENAANNNIVLLYNGEDLGMATEDDYKDWLLDECGVEPETLEQLTLFEKNYGFFRACMDEGLEDETIVEVGRYMYKNGIMDSRFVEEDDWSKIKDQIDDDQQRDLLDELLVSEMEVLHIPELVEFLDGRIKNAHLTGGAEGECLDEVQIVLDILDIEYKYIDKFLY